MNSGGNNHGNFTRHPFTGNCAKARLDTAALRMASCRSRANPGAPAENIAKIFC